MIKDVLESTPKPGQCQFKQIYISSLINTIFYYLHCVFIMTVNGKYRLVVIRNNRVLAYNLYTTIRGAKIAFSKKFKGWKKEIKAEWSHFYDPDKPWLDEKLNIADKAEREHE